MKVYTGADAGTGYVHTVTAIPVNVHDIEETIKLVRKMMESYMEIPDIWIIIKFTFQN